MPRLSGPGSEGGGVVQVSRCGRSARSIRHNAEMDASRVVTRRVGQ